MYAPCPFFRNRPTRVAGIAAVFILLSGAALWCSDDCTFSLARLQYDGGGDWYANPSSLPNLLRALRERTPVPVCPEPRTVSLASDDLYQYPFIHITGHGNISFSPDEQERLRRYLTGGGFLFVDDNYGLDRPFRREIARIYPGRKLIELPASHPVYTSFYTLSGVPKIHEHDGDPAQAFGLFIDGRMVLLYTFSSDIGDGLEDPDVHNDPPEKHEAALRFAINVVMYFLKGL